MKYLPIPQKLFSKNRKKFTKHLKKNSLAVFFSNDIMPTSADGTMKFIQHSDIFYLSGIDQEKSILVIFPDSPEEKHKEILFLKETNENIAIWEGHKYTKQEAEQTSGIKTVYWLSEFDTVFRGLMSQTKRVYLNTNEHYRALPVVETANDRFIKLCKEKYPLHKLERSAPIMHSIRAVKSELEIDLLQKACDITEKAFRRVLKFVTPKKMEYEVEAEIIHEFLSNRATGFAFDPIIASGYNACVLHYIANNQPCKDGDLLLIDTGAQYARYNADMTRTIPVNGKYNKRQKEVYNSVLHVHREAVKLLKEGNSLPKYHIEVGKIMESELLSLKLLDKTDIKNQDKNWPAYKKYFMHGTSHHLGLDVHDYGNTLQKMKDGMVLTVEPGIYIREEKLGVRIENDIVIHKGGNIDLTKNIPIEAEEIEELMNR